MKNIISLILLLIVAGAAAVYFVWGPNVLFGGPKNSDIIEVTKTVMVATSGSDEQKAIATAAKIAPHGICNKIASKFACGVTVTLPDGTSKDFVSVLQKNAAGAWIAAD